MAYNTANMSLRAWDLGDDPYAHTELASNFVAIDAHDHTPGKGVRIPTAGIADNAITSAKIADGTIQTQDLADGAVTGTKISSDLIPLGIVDFWYRQSTGEPVPTGYEICDGRAWSTITNDLGYSTGSIPNLIGKFPMGAAATGSPAVGSTGGVNTIDLSHTHTVAAHTHTFGTHTHTIAGHAHGLGSHTHPIPSQGGLQFLDDDGNPQTLAQRGVPVGGGANRQTAYVPNLNSGNDPSKSADMTVHNHGGNTGAASGSTDTQSLTTNAGGAGTTDPTAPVTGGTSPSLATVDNRPSYVGLLPIMRVRR